MSVCTRCNCGRDSLRWIPGKVYRSCLCWSGSSSLQTQRCNMIAYRWSLIFLIELTLSSILIYCNLLACMRMCRSIRSRFGIMVHIVWMPHRHRNGRIVMLLAIQCPHRRGNHILRSYHKVYIFERSHAHAGNVTTVSRIYMSCEKSIVLQITSTVPPDRGTHCV